MPAIRPAGRPPRRIAAIATTHRRGVALATATAVLLLGCTAADDGVRVRDRDGAGVLFEDET